MIESGPYCATLAYNCLIKPQYHNIFQMSVFPLGFFSAPGGTKFMIWGTEFNIYQTTNDKTIG